MVKGLAARYVGVFVERLKPGYRREYEESVKLDVAAYAKAGITNERWIAYQVSAGVTGGMYIYFAPMASLAEWDVDNEKAYAEAMGESGRSRQTEITRQALSTTEFHMFAVSPKMSYVSKELAAVDPDFWTPKTATGKGKVPAVKTDKAKP